MHMAWLRHIGGRLKSGYRHSIGLVYNTFPTPPEGAELSKLEPLAQAVLAARAAYPGATLADLYDPDLMPPNLRRAHQALDRAVDRLYRPRGFASERERVEHLFTLYEKMQAPLEAARKAKPRKRRTGRPAARPACTGRKRRSAATDRPPSSRGMDAERRENRRHVQEENGKTCSSRDGGSRVDA